MFRLAGQRCGWVCLVGCEVGWLPRCEAGDARRGAGTLAAITIWGTLRVPFFGLPRSILDCFDADFCSLRLILQLFFKLFKIISTSFQISANFHDFCTVFQNSAQFRQNSRKGTDFCKIRQMLLKHLVEFCKISQILMRVISQTH